MYKYCCLGLSLLALLCFDGRTTGQNTNNVIYTVQKTLQGLLIQFLSILSCNLSVLYSAHILLAWRQTPTSWANDISHICQLEWNFMQSVCVPTNLLIFPLMKLELLWTFSYIFLPLNVFLPRQSQVLAYHLFLCCQYRFSLEYATIPCSPENYVWIVSLGLLITTLSLDNSWFCISWRVKKSYILFMSTLLAVILCNHQSSFQAGILLLRGENIHFIQLLIQINRHFSTNPNNVRDTASNKL